MNGVQILLIVGAGIAISAVARRYKVESGLVIVVLAAAAFVVVNLVVDLLYPLLDPRIARTPKVSRA